MTCSSERRALLSLIEQHGFVLHRQGKHYVFKNASGKTLVVSKSATDRRAFLNIKATMKRLLAS